MITYGIADINQLEKTNTQLAYFRSVQRLLQRSSRQLRLARMLVATSVRLWTLSPTNATLATPTLISITQHSRRPWNAPFVIHQKTSTALTVIRRTLIYASVAKLTTTWIQHRSYRQRTALSSVLLLKRPYARSAILITPRQTAVNVVTRPVASNVSLAIMK